MRQIEKYLNSIFQSRTMTTENEVIFCGDGEGDFEKRTSSATHKVLTNYIIYCQKQIQLAKDALLNQHDIIVK